MGLQWFRLRDVKDERNIVKFSLEGYGELLDLLKGEQYEISDYHNWENRDKCAILRHDIDTSLEAALSMAQLESAKGVSSTYFVLVTSDMYNALSAHSRRIMSGIQGLGHEIGLHFDEVVYAGGGSAFIVESILREARILSEVVEAPITAVSMHRPSSVMLESDMEIPDMVNSYSQLFFKEFKYVSDSRMRWREPVEEIIRSGEYPRLHILTHAFWYKDQDMKTIIADFVKSATADRYTALAANFTDLEEVIVLDEL